MLRTLRENLQNDLLKEEDSRPVKEKPKAFPQKIERDAGRIMNRNRNREFDRFPVHFFKYMLKREKMSRCIDFAYRAAYNESITAET